MCVGVSVCSVIPSQNQWSNRGMPTLIAHFFEASCSRQKAGIVYLRRGGEGFTLKRLMLKNALSNQLPQNPSAATSRHAPSWKLAR